jgi:fructosamine-3-kinase
MLDKALKSKVEEVLSKSLEKEVKIEMAIVQSGGSINDAFKLETNIGPYFLKTNSASKYPKMFQREMEGLLELSSQGSLRIPKPILYHDFDSESILIMEFIQKGSPSDGFWKYFGQQLATMHQESNDNFGFETDNYIGSLIQTNNWTSSWSEFFISNRLEPLVKLSRDQGGIDQDMSRRFEKLFVILDTFYPDEPSALIHGDLWIGNFLANEHGKPVIFDHAVYFGHREMDLAMSKLFGGFSQEFYQYYHDAYPLEKEWQSRVGVCNLYPLLVHVILFGEAYFQDVKSILRRMV